MKIEIFSLNDSYLDRNLIEFAELERKNLPGSSLSAMKGSAWASMKMPSRDWKTFGFAQLNLKISNLLVLHPSVELHYWINALDPGAWISEHDHDGALLSGTYYPNVEPGFYEFNSAEIEYTFPGGVLVVFDPKMKHSVPKNQNSMTRWSFAFNAYRAKNL